jgi:DNA-directed RNA polymerase subunit RPC12/RpoP
MTYPEPYGLECGGGWKNIIDHTHEKLKYIDPDYKIAQIKEKFGGLRYYFDASIEYGSLAYDIMNDIVKAAEYEASYTCELCGSQGLSKGVKTRNDHGWYYTYCKECSDKVIAERKKRFNR